jgi:tetratricopeptide (TPR) repeat protein
MDSRQAEHLFHEADVLFRQGQYAQALQRLDYLAEQYPNESNILYPRSLALTQLGRYSEALEVCERLIHQHHFEKAHQLKDEIRTRQLSQQKPPPSKSFDTPPEIPGVESPVMPQVNIDELLNQPPAYARPTPGATARRPIASGGLPWPVMVLLAAAGMAVLGAVVSAVTGLPPIVGVLSFGVGFVLNVGLVWGILRIVNQLTGDIDEDMKQISIAVGALLAFNVIPFVGGILGLAAFLYLLSKSFSLSCGTLFLVAVIWFVINAVVATVVFFMFGAALVGMVGLEGVAGG